MMSCHPKDVIDQIDDVIVPWPDMARSFARFFPAKYRQSARISVTVHRFRQYGIAHLLLDTAHDVRYSAA